MFLRTHLLLLLLVSSGMCATLGYYQAEEKEKEEAPAVEAPAVEAPAVEAPAVESAAISEAEAVAADVDVLPPATVETPNGEKIDAEILVIDEAVAEEPKVDVQVIQSETVNESEADQQQQPEEQKKEDSSPEANEIQAVQTTEIQTDDDSWSLSSIRNTFQTAHGYFDSLVELVGGHNGVCQYRCRHGELAEPRPGYELPEPNGCSSSLVGFQIDLGIPAMTKCCNMLDTCYDTCGTSKYDCDSKFRLCLHDICSDLKKSLGFESKVQACESMADGLYNTVWTLGCRPYMNSQRAACVCSEEEKDEL